MSSAQPVKIWRDRALPLVVLGALSLGLWASRPRSQSAALTSQKLEYQQTCLSNLGRIGLAFAAYAQDYDGKFPRGVDAEDRANPQIWSHAQLNGNNYVTDARKVPMLQDLLAQYLPDKSAWHCPADIGWKTSRLAEFGITGSLTNVAPSSFAKFGTSYGYLTIHGFAGMRARDVRHPADELLLFDSDLWHAPEGAPSLNGLFADGHAQNLSGAEFNRLSSLG